METEKNYFDTSCQKCGHVPQGERHLCNWETPKEHAQSCPALHSDECVCEPLPDELFETSKENWRYELHKIWSNATALIEIEELIESLLLTQRQEYTQQILDAWSVEGRNPEYHRLVKDRLKAEWPTLYYAISDLSERIEKK